MPDDGEHPAAAQQDSPQGSSSQVAVAESTPGPSPSSTAGEDRIALLDRARAFLASPTVVHQDPSTKRHFLVEKGLREYEIEGLMREVVRSFELLNCFHDWHIQLLVGSSLLYHRVPTLNRLPRVYLSFFLVSPKS